MRDIISGPAKFAIDNLGKFYREKLLDTLYKVLYLIYAIQYPWNLISYLRYGVLIGLTDKLRKSTRESRVYIFHACSTRGFKRGPLGASDSAKRLKFYLRRESRERSPDTADYP